MAINPVEVKITGDASGLTKAAGVAQGSLSKLQTQMVSLETLSAKGFSFSGLAGIGLSATAAAAALVGAVKSAADYGDQLDNMSQRTGVAVEELARLQYAAKMSDTSAEALGKGLGFLAKTMVAAANGGAESGKLFEKYGIDLRNTDKTVKSTSEVLMDLADVFSAMPDGAEKAALATEFFGKKMGAEMIPLLNTGREGIKAFGDEAERLGLVLTGKQAKAAADFNDNLDKMAFLAKGVAVSIGNELIPVLNKFLAELEDASKSGLTFWEKLGLGLEAPGASPEDQLKKATDALVKLKAKQDELYKSNKADPANAYDTSQADGDVASMERRVEYFKLQSKRIEDADKASAVERAKIAAELQRETARLEKLKAIDSGKANADILMSDKERTAEQIKDAEKLRAALQAAWTASRDEAIKAGDEAKKLFEKASGVRTSAKDKAADMRMSGMSEEEKQAANLSQALDAQSQGSYYAAASAAAKLDGRTADFEKYQKQAESFLDRAMKFAEKSGDANLVEGVGGQQAGLIEQQAKSKEQEAAKLQEQATAQAATIKQLDTDIEALKAKASSVEIKFDITQAEGAVAGLQKKLDELKDKTVTVTVNQVGSAAAIAAGAANQAAEAANPTGFASGGHIRGPGSGTSDSILARLSNGEYVVKAAAVNHYGAGLLSRINNMQIPKFASGGQVGPASSGGSPLVLDFGKLGRYNAIASSDTAKEIERVFKRASLSYGRK